MSAIAKNDAAGNPNGASHTVRKFAVRAAPKNGGETMTLRLFDTEDEAVDHALKVNMRLWDDVFIEPRELKREVSATPPPFPWSVQWIGGYAYVVDASGRKIASLLGPQAQREAVAEIVCDMRSARHA